nr:ribonuclease H domain-containing protein [Tanacetum cinerariifolium]
VTAQSCSCAVFNHFMRKFECSSSSQTPNKMAEQKEESCLDAATVVNKEADAHCMVSNQSLQDQFHVLRWPLTIPQNLNDRTERRKLLGCCNCCEQRGCCTRHGEAKLLQGMKLPECPHEGCKSRLDINSCMEFLTPKSYEIMILREKEASIPPVE